MLYAPTLLHPYALTPLHFFTPTLLCIWRLLFLKKYSFENEHYIIIAFNLGGKCSFDMFAVNAPQILKGESNSFT